MNEKYPHVVYEERCKGYDEQSETTSVEDDGSDKIEGIIIYSFVFIFCVFFFPDNLIMGPTNRLWVLLSW